MHILEQYSLSCGLKIDKPYIFEKFFPIPFDKYIVLDVSSEFENQKYNYWKEVIDFVAPYLDKNNIKIIHLINENETILNNCLTVQAQLLTPNHKAFIIKNSLMYVGTNNFDIQLASSYDKQIVSLYSNLLPNQIGPFWSNQNNIKLLTPDFKDKKPSYFTQENKKLINTIKPELISKSICDLLEIKDINYNKTLYIGDRYGIPILEAFPDQVIPQSLFPNYLLNIRLDYKENLEDSDYNYILSNLQLRPCALVTNKKINLQPFLQFKERVTNIFYDITENIDIEFINELNFYGFKFILIFNESENNTDILNNRKFELIDIPQNIEIVNKNTNLDIDIKENTFYKSFKFIFKNNKVYNSKSASIQDIPLSNIQNIDEIQILKIKDQKLFFKEDLEYSYIFEKI